MVHPTLLEELDTPALVVDLDVMERNIERMAALAREAGVRLRPHVKTHKSPWIAHQQLRAGAAGITVAKLGEAEEMVEAGITEIFIAYPIIGEQKLRRFQELLDRVDLMVAVDSVEGAEPLGRAARKSRRGRVRVFVDVDTGHRRLGLPPGEPSADLARRIAGIEGIQVVGLMSHAGHLASAATQEALAEEARRAAASLVATAEALRRRGLPVEHVSPGTTPGAAFEARVPGVTEIRPGTYVFNDRNTVDRWAATEADCALTVLATVVSRPSADRAVIDAGSKVLSSDRAVGSDRTFGLVVGRPDLRLERLSEEHGILAVEADGPGLRVGDRLQVIPNHVCTAVNLSDLLYGYRDGRVVKEIPVAARGRSR